MTEPRANPSVVGTTCTAHLPNWLARRADLAPDRLALVARQHRLTFRQLDRRVSRAARRLALLGIGAGDRVAVLLSNGPAFVELVHAMARLGSVLVPLNTRLTPSELAWQLADSGARLLVYDDANASLAQRAGAAVPDLRLVLSPSVGEALAGIDEADVPLRDLIDLAAVHCIIYTSGTTGRPKGAMLTYGNHWWSAIGSALNLGCHDDDRWLAALPLFHVGGLAILLRCAIYGIPAIVHESFDPAEVNRSIDADGVTIVSVVSTMLRRMLAERGRRPYPPTLRCILVGGGPVPRSVLEACAARGLPVVQTYGLTEAASQVATLSPADALRKLGSAGQPLLPVELRVLRDGLPAAPGEVGEIVVRGPTVTPGYVNRPEETARTIRGGWLYTGDLGYLDSEGYLYVVERRSDLIVSGGENVYPAEVEAVLLAHPAIEDAGVIGVPDEEWGQVPVAFVRTRAGATLDEAALIAFCAERLARFKVPKKVWIVDDLPRNAAGKLRRQALRASVPARREGGD